MSRLNVTRMRRYAHRQRSRERWRAARWPALDLNDYQLHIDRLGREFTTVTAHEYVDLDAIEERAGVALSATPPDPFADGRVIRDDVPALVAEVRRLRSPAAGGGIPPYAPDPDSVPAWLSPAAHLCPACAQGHWHEGEVCDSCASLDVARGSALTEEVRTRCTCGSIVPGMVAWMTQHAMYDNHEPTFERRMTTEWQEFKP